MRSDFSIIIGELYPILLLYNYKNVKQFLVLCY
jgi:hypothetical protein